MLFSSTVTFRATRRDLLRTADYFEITRGFILKVERRLFPVNSLAPSPGQHMHVRCPRSDATISFDDFLLFCNFFVSNLSLSDRSEWLFCLCAP